LQLLPESMLDSMVFVRRATRPWPTGSSARGRAAAACSCGERPCPA
jgi:hypothetical protein